MDIEDEFKKGKRCIKVGELTSQVIESLHLDTIPCNILMKEDRIEHIVNRHRTDFQSEDSFEKYVSMIPEAIQSPDYIGLHPNKKSIEYIKRVDGLLLVAVRISNGKNLFLKTAFPIKESKLQSYIESGSIVTIND
ncbi:MAG: hypothetical protein LKJ50_05305 [Clostridiales bacterium]|jgi:hypothetical protein|nr:hypothetical protein [Clostridiales bacterium]MCI1961354.1 hypothetical protein [Clostridiales bacterium]MCI2021795.1 hypothetical protein [Clostridiales bacterium]MCI2026582.1 hypothetical protein [Clostridiales bacterium]